jgi:uncharacterized BrkB/YihY/UPF0761 family membrane protein
MEALIFGLVGVVVFGSVGMLLEYPAFGLSFIDAKLIAGGITLLVLLVMILFVWLFVWRPRKKEVK